MPRQPLTITSRALTPVGGLNAVSSIMQMPPADAVVMENWIPYPDKVTTRNGCADHATGFANPVKRLWVYAAANGGESLWATTDAGIYNATAAGAIGAAAVALTDGRTVSVVFSTGAGNNYMFVVNGVDTLKMYDGAAWTAPGMGAFVTSTISYVEAYRQRLFFVVRNSLDIAYLAANAIPAGVAPTVYTFSSIFRRGGYIVAIGTWTIDGGNGPDDQFVIVTNMGEVAVFTGNDPATWTLKGVYFIGRPLGRMPLFKYGGDLLFLCEAGLFPLSKALLTASIDRTQAVTDKIRQLFANAATSFFSEDGWQIIAQPEIPLLIVNIPGTSMKLQFCMHAITGSWTIFSGWEANCFARMGSVLYFGMSNKVAAVGGASDFGANITATLLTSYSTAGYPRKKHIKLIRPYFEANGNFSFVMGVAQDFVINPYTTTVTPGGVSSAALWGTGVWGTSFWSASSITTNDWRVVPDIYSTWKALYLQVVSNAVTVSYLGADLRLMPGSDF